MKDHLGKCLARKVRELYEKGENDGDMKPVVAHVDGKPFGRVKDGDAVIFCCKRGEREIQLTEAFVMPDFKEFEVKKFNKLDFVTLVKYDEKFGDNVKLAFDFPPLEDTLSEVVSKHGFRQLHMAESEKYAHVTFFFNGRNRSGFPNEDDVLIPSPEVEDLSGYPQLSIYEMVNELNSRIESLEYDFILANLANGDVIGHLLDMEPKIECVKHLSNALEKIVNTALKKDYAVIITADHGLIEVGLKTLNPPIPNPGHTTNPVPFFLLLPDGRLKIKEKGILGNVAPTVLQLMGVEKPKAMTQDSMILGKPKRNYRVLLVIIDGWGLGTEDERNPIYIAKPKFWYHLMNNYDFAKLGASGEAVGLMPGHPGNSEAGHMNLGAGRIVLQDEEVIGKSLRERTFAERKAFVETFERLTKEGGDLHLITMLSLKSSHGTIEYPLALVEKAKNMNIGNIYIHAIFNRHGAEEVTGAELLELFDEKLNGYQNTFIVTSVGRKWALDRDKHYDRTKVAYDALITGKGEKAICQLFGQKD